MRLPGWVRRLLPSERYRATAVLVIGGVAGYLSPPLIGAFTDRWQFPLARASFEQLRRDVRGVPCAEAQQVLSQVIAANMEIERKHVERTLWYTKWFVAAGWLTVEVIPLPCERERAE